MIRYVFLIMCLLFFSFVPRKKSEEFDYRARAHKLALQKANQICKKYHMSIYGHGGSMMNEIEQIDLHFAIPDKPMNKEEARRMIVNITKELIAFFDSCQELIPYYKNYPLQATNFHIAISAMRRDFSYFGHPYISRVSIRFGKIYYYTYDPENQYQYKTEEEETWEEACEIVRREKEGYST
jgi:hypothetical protein